MKMYARLAFFALCLHLPAKAVEPDARCVFYIKIVANTLNGLWRPGDTLVGDQLFLYESPNGAVIVKRHEGDHTLSGKAVRQTRISGLANRIRRNCETHSKQQIYITSTSKSSSLRQRLANIC